MKEKPKLPSTRTGRTRLLKLAALLEADAKNKKGVRFNMEDWGSVTNSAKPISCGTTACAMGLAALSGAFKRAGLTATIRGSYILFDLGGEESASGIPPAMDLFDITSEEAEWLFYGDCLGDGVTTGVRAERRMAKIIRDFVAGRTTP